MGDVRPAPALRLIDGARYALVDGARQKRSNVVSIKLTRAIVLGFVTLLTMGSIGASAAFAGPGPFWHHRAVHGEGNGLKIEAATPESFNGEGGTQILVGKLSSQEVEIVAKSVQAKGIIYNNGLQGQIKVTLLYHEPKLVKPAGLSGCQVKIGFNKNNEVVAEGHLAWKYRGVGSELTESPVTVQKPDIIFTPAPIKQGETKLPEGTFTEINLSPSKECGVLVGTFAVKGSQSASPKPENIGEWNTVLLTEFPGAKEQHFWNGSASIAANPELKFGNNLSTLTGSVEAKAAQQEISVFEK
jgi:hypothetical protein